MNEGKDRTMDRKQIKKSITKNKAAVLIAALALFVAIILIFLFHSLERQEKEQQALSMEEREQLMDMTEYLDEIDGIVTMNQERLAEATLFQSDTENVLNTFQESLSVLEKDMERVETVIQSHTETETSTNSEISSSFETLSESQKEIKEQITTVNASIAEIISEIRTENENNFTSAFGKLEKLEDDIVKTQKEAESYYDSLTELITLLQKDSSSQYEELTNTLLAAQADLAELLKNGFEALKLQLDEDFTALMEKLECLHGQIIDAADSITGLLELMEENNKDRQEDIEAAFASVSESLELIRTEYTDAHMEIQSLIQKVQETQNANHEETLSVLTVMENNMEETSLENLNQLTNSLQMMEENFSASISNMKGEMEQSFSTLNTGIENSFSQTNDNITNQFRELNTSISNQYQNISSTIINNNDSQQESLDNLMGYLSQKLQEVFQFVSNGKKKLASALLTKGIPVREDATFDEIYQAILDIQQTLVIGVQQIPGTISYDYHFHVDGNGDQIHSNTSPYPGGCYLQTKHQDYEVVGSHEEERIGMRQDKGECGCGNSGYDYGYAPCPICGHNHWGSSCRVMVEKQVPYTYTVTVKDYGWVTKNYYDLNCIFSDGQILGAHIVYDTNALGAAAVAYEKTAIREEIIRIDDEIQEVYGDAAESGLGETEPEQEKAENKEKGEATDGGEPGKDDSEEETEVKQETEVTKEPGNTQESKEAAKETAETENLKTAEEQEEE